eukprot:gene102-511_t
MQLFLGLIAGVVPLASALRGDSGTKNVFKKGDIVEVIVNYQKLRCTVIGTPNKESAQYKTQYKGEAKTLIDTKGAVEAAEDIAKDKTQKENKGQKMMIFVSDQ